MMPPPLDASVDEMLAAAAADGGDPAAGNAFLTGRSIVTYARDEAAGVARSLGFNAGARVASAEDFDDGIVDFAALGDAQSVLFPELGVALLSAEPEARGMVATMAADATNPIATIEPETFVFPSARDLGEYLRGFAAASARIGADWLDQAGDAAAAAPGTVDAAALAATWGLQATGAATNPLTGRGIKVAVLDTGFYFPHPDFAGRPVAQASFIFGQTALDVFGHGTHCMGTACGPRAPAGVPRYGIASEASIFVGKVLSNTGSGTSATVLAGMNWAVANRCPVISMSLGAPGGPAAFYTQAGQAALNAGCLIVAAAGNESRRPGTIAPTGSPGNSPTIMSVAAVDDHLRIAVFSCGGKVEIAGPGVDVFSSWPLPLRYKTISGTSMATPHVAGIAALLAQSSPTLRGIALWRALTGRTRHLPLPASDVGAGLVHV